MNRIADGGYGIVWLLGAFDMGIGPDRERVSLGICRATDQLAFFSGGSGAPLLSNLTVVSGRCSQGAVCLYHLCPCNRTSWYSYRIGSAFGRGVRSPQGFEGLKEVRRQMHRDLILMEDFGQWIGQTDDRSQGYCIEMNRPVIRVDGGCAGSA